MSWADSSVGSLAGLPLPASTGPRLRFPSAQAGFFVQIQNRDGAELDQSERKAIFDFVQAVHDAATELKRKLRMQH